MPGRVIRKWRPPLALVVGGTLAGVLGLPILGLFAIGPLAAMIGAGPARWVVLGGVVLATLVLGWLLRRLILRPIQALAARAARLPDDVDGGGDHFGTAEIGSLGRAVEDMATRLQARELAVRGFTDHVTHELKTPLAAIRGSVELLADDPDLPDSAKGRVAAIAEAETRMEHLLSAARDIARARIPLPMGTTPLAALEADLAASAGDAVLTFEGALCAIPMAEDGLRVILQHLVRNAVEAGASRITIAATESGTVTVSDNGPGISAGNMDRLFEPFFTTRRDTGGTGMGLAIAQAMVQAQGGTLEVTESGPSGATFRLTV